MADWNIHFGEVSKSYPILITEWGFIVGYINSEYSYLIGNVKSFGKPFLDNLNELQIGWLACWYDDNWQPAMFTPGFEDTIPYGDFNYYSTAEKFLKLEISNTKTGSGDSRLWYTGMGQALLLDRLMPDWKEVFFKQGSHWKDCWR